MPEAPPAGIVVHDPGRDVIEFVGPDAGAFLHSQLAQDIAAIGAGGSVHSLLLEPTGHLTAILRVTRVSDERYLVDVDAGHADAVMARLSRFVLRAKVTVSRGETACVSVRGPGARRWALSVAGNEAATTVTWWDVEGSDTDACDIVGSFVGLPAPNAPLGPYEQMRADAGWPRLGVDVEPGDLPATTGLIPVAVSFSKGCYPGQELVERMDSRGAGAPVTLRRLSAGALSPGDPVLLDGREVGTVTSVGRRHALARVKRGADVGAVVGGDADR